jgi:hypothetical protein
LLVVVVVRRRRIGVVVAGLALVLEVCCCWRVKMKLSATRGRNKADGHVWSCLTWEGQ